MTEVDLLFNILVQFFALSFALGFKDGSCVDVLILREALLLYI